MCIGDFLANLAGTSTELQVKAMEDQEQQEVLLEDLGAPLVWGDLLDLQLAALALVAKRLLDERLASAEEVEHEFRAPPDHHQRLPRQHRPG